MFTILFTFVFANVPGLIAGVVVNTPIWFPTAEFALKFPFTRSYLAFQRVL